MELLRAGVGGLLFCLGLLIWGILTLVSVSLPALVVAIWAIVTGLLLLIGR